MPSETSNQPRRRGYPLKFNLGRRRLEGGALQDTEKKPKGPHYELQCSQGHRNWISKTDHRIGTVHSEIPYIFCLQCGEKLKGGKYHDKRGE